MLLFLSCEDNFTDIDRDFIITEDIIQDLDDVEKLMGGAYNSLNYNNLIARNSYASDEVRIGLENLGEGVQEYQHAIVSGSGPAAGTWSGLYNALDNFNRVISNLDRIEIAEENQERANSIRGQSLAVRAMIHFDLLRLFATDFNANTPGVILVLSPLNYPEDDLSQPRATVGEVLAAIEDDLNTASTLIPESLSTNYEFFNLNAVAALRARIALYTENYQEAIDQATIVIDNVPALSPGQYFDMFRANRSPDDGTPTETIFQVERDINNQRVGEIYTESSERVSFSMSTSLFSVFAEADDIRLPLNVDLETDITAIQASADEIIVGKYLGIEDEISLNHVRLFRTSEMILIRAEANARLNNLALAQTEIEQFRNLRGSQAPTPGYGSVEVATLDILKERQIELAFEGHRLFDLKRYGLPLLRAEEDCNNLDRAAPTSCALQAGDFRFTYPIPQEEIFANPGISDADQNPGY